MTDGELAGELSAATEPFQGSRFEAVVSEIDRRDRQDKADRIRGLYAQHPVSEGARNRVYQGLVDLGENPEDAWAHAHGTNTEAMQRKAVILQLRAEGYKGGGFDALARDAFKTEVQRRVLQAETDTNGYMLSPDGKQAGVDPWSLFTGPEPRARKYASSELREWWDMNGRPTVDDYQATLMGHAASAGPRGGDFYA